MEDVETTTLEQIEELSDAVAKCNRALDECDQEIIAAEEAQRANENRLGELRAKRPELMRSLETAQRDLGEAGRFFQRDAGAVPGETTQDTASDGQTVTVSSTPNGLYPADAVAKEVDADIATRRAQHDF